MAPRKAKRRGPLPPLPAIPDGTKFTVESVAWVVAMAQLARDGDEEAAKALVGAHRTNPELWDRFSGLADNAERVWLDHFAPNTTEYRFERIAVEHQLAATKADLLAGSDDPVDKLLVGRIAVNWLAAQQADQRQATVLASPQGISLAQAESVQKRAEAANRNLLRAVETLARVRRLRGFAVQINVAAAGGQQVNVANASVGRAGADQHAD